MTKFQRIKLLRKNFGRKNTDQKVMEGNWEQNLYTEQNKFRSKKRVREGDGRRRMVRESEIEEAPITVWGPPRGDVSMRAWVKTVGREFGTYA